MTIEERLEKLERNNRYLMAGLVTVILLGIGVAAVQAGTSEENLVQQAKQCNKAWNAGDYETFAQFVFPPMVEQMGGRAAVIGASKKAVRDLESSGLTVLDQRVGQASRVIKEEYGLAAFVQTEMDMKFEGKKYKKTSFLVAISDDGGNRWYILDGARLPEAKLLKLFPRLCRVAGIPEIRDEFREFAIKVAREALRGVGTATTKERINR